MGLAAHNERGNAMGMADYMVDNLRAAVDDMDMVEIHTMLTALVQIQALIGAQASQVLQDRVQEIQRDSEAFVEVPVEEDDTTELMQRSMNRATAEDGISTFGHWLQRVSDSLVDMGVEDAALCSQLLLAQLRTRYGQGTGRTFMGERAASLAALAIAHQGSPATEEQIRASPFSRDWSRMWWETLLPGIRAEDLIHARQMNEAVVVESQSSQASNCNNEGKQGMDETLHREREEVEEDLRDAKRQKQALEERHLAEYEEALEEDRLADEERYREYEAQCAASKAQTWEDWAVQSEMGKAASSSSWMRVRMVAQLHGQDGRVLEHTALQHDDHDGWCASATFGCAWIHVGALSDLGC